MSSVFGTMHGQSCSCDACMTGRISNQERLSSTERLAWLESRVLQIQDQLSNIAKGKNTMGMALWCQKGGHAFDENDEDAERMVVDKRDPDTGRKTGEEKIVHMCGRHAAEAFAPKARSLAEITAEINAAEELGE